jgi:hypothetical protein
MVRRTSKINGHALDFAFDGEVWRANSRLAVEHDSFPSAGQ